MYDVPHVRRAGLRTARPAGDRPPHTQPVTDSKVNLYFGNRLCLNAVRTFVHKPLNELTPEEDFMLGAMLGYDIARQCERFCKRKRLLA